MIFIIVSICFVILGTAGGLATFFLMKNKNENRTEILKEKNDKTKKANKQTSLEDDMKELEKLIMRNTFSEDMKDIEDLIKQGMKNSSNVTKYTLANISITTVLGINKTKPGKPFVTHSRCFWLSALVSHPWLPIDLGLEKLYLLLINPLQ